MDRGKREGGREFCLFIFFFFIRLVEVALENLFSISVSVSVALSLLLTYTQNTCWHQMKRDIIIINRPIYLAADAA